MIIGDLRVGVIWKLQSTKSLEFAVRCNDKRITKQTSDILKTVFDLYQTITLSYEPMADVQDDQEGFDQ